jgi:copper chaperone CopZ
MSAETVTLPVAGMTCGNCARSVERKLTATSGVSNAKVNLEAASATVKFDPSQTAVPKLIAAIEQLGYEVPSPPK